MRGLPCTEQNEPRRLREPVVSKILQRRTTCFGFRKCVPGCLRCRREPLVWYHSNVAEHSLLWTTRSCNLRLKNGMRLGDHPPAAADTRRVCFADTGKAMEEILSPRSHCLVSTAVAAKVFYNIFSGEHGSGRALAFGHGRHCRGLILTVNGMPPMSIFLVFRNLGLGSYHGSSCHGLLFQDETSPEKLSLNDFAALQHRRTGTGVSSRTESLRCREQATETENPAWVHLLKTGEIFFWGVPRFCLPQACHSCKTQ